MIESFTLFEGFRMVGTGSLAQMAQEARRISESGSTLRLALFNDVTGRTVDWDLGDGTPLPVPLCSPTAGADEETPPKRPGPGRPALGVVSREVSLLPRHWEWLNSQPNGASGTLRMLVEEARKKNAARDAARAMRDAIHQFLWEMAGDLEGFEEATRAFFAKDYERYFHLTSHWPEDIKKYVEPRVKALANMLVQG